MPFRLFAALGVAIPLVVAAGPQATLGNPLESTSGTDVDASAAAADGSGSGSVADLDALPIPAGTTCDDGRVRFAGQPDVALTLADGCPGEDGRAVAGGQQADAPGSAGPADCLVPTYDDRCEAWASAPYDGGAARGDTPGAVLATRIMQASPDGRQVFVAGSRTANPSGPTDWDAVTIAYDAATGARTWTRALPGVGARDTALSHSLVVAPDGRTVYTLVDVSNEAGSSPVIVAHDIRDGDRRWVHASGRQTTALDLAIGPDGDRLYYGTTASLEIDGETRPAMTVVAVDAATGQEVWQSAYPGATDLGAVGWVVDVSPDGSTVFMAGGEQGEQGLRKDFTTVAFDAAEDGQAPGAVRWVAHGELSEPDRGNNGVLDVVASPDSSRVFVTGVDRASVDDLPLALYEDSALLTYAHDADTGERLWQGRYAGPDVAYNHDALYNGTLATSPDGSRVFVAGLQSRPWVNSRGWAVVAYDAASGDRAWAEDSRDNHNLAKLLFGPYPSLAAGENRVFVTGYRGGYQAWEYGTAAYDMATGDQEWMARFTRGRGLPVNVATSPDGNRVYVAGRSALPAVSAPFIGRASVPGDSYDIQTVAYDAGGRQG